jgi:hypothetical protein
MFFEWHPTVIHDLHEAVPLLMTWNGTGPYNPDIDPITLSEFLSFSFYELQTMTGLGMPGVSTWNFGEGFAEVFLDSIAMNHNAMGRGFETFGNGTAETLARTLTPDETSKEWYRPLPPSGKFAWSARDNVNYNETGMLASLDYAAGNSQQLLRNFYSKSLHSYRKGIDEPPFAFLVPEDQGDPQRVAQLVARLMSQHIEVARARTPVSLKEGSFPAGTYVVRLDQPYRSYAVDLLSPQHYPKDATEPYDDISWELPAHYHLQVLPTGDPAIRSAGLELLTAPPQPRGRITKIEGANYLLRDSGQEGVLEARFLLSQFDVQVAEQSFTAGSVSYPAGSWIIAGQNGVSEALQHVADRLGFTFEPTSTLPNVPRHSAKIPRLGVWVPWADTDSAGWVRYSLDQRKVPYVYIRDEDVRAGK